MAIYPEYFSVEEFNEYYGFSPESKPVSSPKSPPKIIFDKKEYDQIALYPQYFSVEEFNEYYGFLPESKSNCQPLDSSERK